MRFWQRKDGSQKNIKSVDRFLRLWGVPVLKGAKGLKTTLPNTALAAYSVCSNVSAVRKARNQLGKTAAKRKKEVNKLWKS